MNRLKHVRNWVCGMQIAFLICGGFSWMITSQHGVHYGANSESMLYDAFHSSLRWSWQSYNHQRFGSSDQLTRVILRRNPSATVYTGTEEQALDYLHTHPGRKHTATIFITKDSDGTLSMVGRDGHDIAARYSGDLTGKTSEQTLEPKTHSDWNGALPLVLGIEESIFLAFGLLGGLTDARSAGRRRKESDDELASWHERVPADELYGPAKPANQFSLLAPVCRDHDGISWFEAVAVEWQEDRYTGRSRWQELKDGEPRKTVTQPDDSEEERVWRAGEWQAYTPLPDEVKAFRAPVDASIEEATATWVSFCHRVAAQNARVWAIRKDNDLKRQHLKELTGTPLQEILTPAAKVLEGLTVEPS